VHSAGILLDNNNLTALPNMSLFNVTNNVSFSFSIRNNQITTVPTDAFVQSAQQTL
jgi:predicted hotdog family 3-hydroxylacyl-ACP dehydratase